MKKLIEKLKRLWRSQQGWTDIVEDEEGNLFLLTPKGEVNLASMETYEVAGSSGWNPQFSVSGLDGLPNVKHEQWMFSLIERPSAEDY